MTSKEFKAWFDGFTESLETTPTKNQWKRIKEQVAKIDGAEITERVFIDRYWPMYYPQYVSYPYHHPYFTPFVGTVGFNTVGDNTVGSGGIGAVNSISSFSSTDAMYALGQTDAFQITA